MSRRRNKQNLSAWQVYSDQLLLILGYFMIMATLLIIVPHLKQDHDGIKPKAEYLVTLTWGDHRDIDLDLWLKHNDCVIYYQSRECIDISLDRDSRGYTSNASVNPDGTPTISPNQEVIAIRAKLPGDFLTAVNYYQRNTDPDLAVDCKVELIKLNPTVQVVQSVKLHFDRQNQTLNAIAFHVDEDGTVKVLPLPAEDLISSISSPLPQ
jgi:hypothetical protein